MSRSQSNTDAPARLALEPLESREVPALGLDPTFGTGGFVLDPVGDVRFTSNATAAAGDKVVVAGNLAGTGPYGNGGDLAVARLTSAGAADAQFGGGDGLATFSFPAAHSVSGVAALPNGKVLVAGTVVPADGTGPSDVYVIRLNADGSRDAGFGMNGEAVVDFGAVDTVRRMVVLADGRILLAGTTAPGTILDPSAQSRLALARLTANGAPDASFGTAGEVIGAAEDGSWRTGGLAVQADGKVLVSGTVTPSVDAQIAGRNSELTVLRFTPTGTPDAAFGAAGRARTQYDLYLFSYANDLALLADGRIVVGGGSSYGQGLLAWFGPTGALLSGEQFSSPFGGALRWIEQLVAMPQGGVEVIGHTNGPIAGTAFEYHPAPGTATDLRFLNAGPWYGAQGGAVLGSGGKLVVSGATGGNPFLDPTTAGVSLSVVRLADPGIAQSPTTFVRWTSRTEVPYGPVTLSAEVVPLFGATAATEGTITFREGSTVLGTLALGAVPTDPWAVPAGVTLTLPAGDHTITAAYSGTGRWSASSATATFRVGQTVAVAATLTVSDTTPAAGEGIALTVALTRTGFGTPAAGGTVTFYDGEIVLGTGPVFAGGMAFLSTDALAWGTHLIRAVYSGSLGFDPAESVPVQVDVGRARTEVALTTSTQAPVAGQPVTLTAVVSTRAVAGGITPGGTVTFSDGSTALGSAPVGPGGLATLSTALRLGTRTLRTTYSGDATTLAAETPPAVVTVGRALTATSLAASAASVAVGQPVTLTATVRPVTGSAFPVGTVEFRAGARVLGTAPLDGRGQAKLVLNSLTAGTHAVTAVYAGCSTCLGSGSAARRPVVVGNPVTAVATTTALTTSVPNPVFRQSQTLTARVTGPTGASPVGRVAFYDGTALLGSAALDSRGEASLSARLNLGAHRLRAVYLGVPAFAGSSSALLSETVAKAPTTMSLTGGADGTVRARVWPAFDGSPIGTVTFKKGSVVLGTAAVNGNGVAAFAFGSLAPGKHRITAVYSGSSCFLGTTSAPLDLTVSG